jgi:hypothetical protein
MIDAIAGIAAALLVTFLVFVVSSYALGAWMERRDHLARIERRLRR